MYIFHLACFWPTGGKHVHASGMNLLTGDYCIVQEEMNNTPALSKSVTLSGIATLNAVYPDGTTGNYVSFKPLIDCKGVVYGSDKTVQEVEFTANQSYTYYIPMVNVIIYE